MIGTMQKLGELPDVFCLSIQWVTSSQLRTISPQDGCDFVKSRVRRWTIAGWWCMASLNTWVSPAVALVLIGTKMFRWFMFTVFGKKVIYFLPNRGLWTVALFLVAKAAVDPDQSTKELRFCFPIDIFDQVVWKEISSYPSFYHIVQLDHVLCFQELEVWRFHPWEEVQGASVSSKQQRMYPLKIKWMQTDLPQLWHNLQGKVFRAANPPTGGLPSAGKTWHKVHRM